MKKLFIKLFILLLPLTANSITKSDIDFSTFDSFQVYEFDYKHENNWNEIVKNNSRLIVFYKIDTYGKSCFITELYYVIQKANMKKILGGFNVKYGFLNADLQHDFDLSSDENIFRKQYLLGLSISTLRHPFSLCGVAKDTNGKVYTTETLKHFVINTKTMSLDEWRPVF